MRNINIILTVLSAIIILYEVAAGDKSKRNRNQSFIDKLFKMEILDNQNHKIKVNTLEKEKDLSFLV